MKIAYISEQDPFNIGLWSGTPFHIIKALKKQHDVVWIGGGIFNGVMWHQKFLENPHPRFVHDYSPEIGRVLSKELKDRNIDIVVSSNYVLCSHLDSDIPFIYFNDIVFSVCEGFFFKPNPDFKYKAKKREEECLRRADAIIFSSEFTKKHAVSDYNLSETDIRVIEFGANIQNPENIILKNYDKNICNLVFVGRNWEKKGGPKVLGAYKLLKQQGFQCKLTIIGSIPKEDIKDENITIIPWLDKSKPKDISMYHDILRNSHFMILPTESDAFGIVICEASAYGVPSIAANVGGVSQPIKEDMNGFLLNPEATAKDYADRIRTLFEDQEKYTALRISSRAEFEKRLNWDIWESKVNTIISDIKNKTIPEKNDAKLDSQLHNFYLPVYVYNLKTRKDRLKHIKLQFKNRAEFNVTYMDAVYHKIGAIGLWKSICNAISLAMERDEDIVILCEDDHEFTDKYSFEYLLNNIAAAFAQGTELLNGGIAGFGNAIPIAKNRIHVDWFWGTQFIVIYKPLFNKILEYEFKDTDTADGVLSVLANNVQVMYPPISTQTDFGYSDISIQKDISTFQNKIFTIANQRLHRVHKQYSDFIFNTQQNCSTSKSNV